jgi:hypothetical protein
LSRAVKNLNILHQQWCQRVFEMFFAAFVNRVCLDDVGEFIRKFSGIRDRLKVERRAGSARNNKFAGSVEIARNGNAGKLIDDGKVV